VVLGLAAAVLQCSRKVNYLLATGLLFHLTIWFADWLGTARHRQDCPPSSRNLACLITFRGGF
jgi:hypothetical protein